MVNVRGKLMKKLILILCLLMLGGCSYQKEQKDEQAANGSVIGEGETVIPYVLDPAFIDGG